MLAWILCLTIQSVCCFWLAYFAAVAVEQQVKLQERNLSEYLGQLLETYVYSLLQTYVIMDAIKVIAITCVSPHWFGGGSKSKRMVLLYGYRGVGTAVYQTLRFVF